MSGAIIQPADFLTELAAVRRRLEDLETQAGVFSSVTVVDQNGIQRVIEGQLPGGDYGIQVNDASGALVMDSTGLAGVAKNLQSYRDSTQILTSSTTAFTLYSTTFTVTQRARNILVLGSLSAAYTWAAPATSSVVDFWLNIPSLSAASQHLIAGSTIAGVIASSFTQYLFVPGVAPGTYTIQWQCLCEKTNNTINTNNVSIDVFQMGG